MIPHVAPPFWPDTRLGRFGAAIYKNSAELVDDAKSGAAIRKCRVGLIGLSDDTGVSLNHGRPGARKGPQAFRAALARYSAARPMASGTAGPYPHVFDAGDIIPSDDIHKTHARVTEAVRAILDLGLFPVGIGGGHDLTFPFVRAVARGCAGIEGVYLDAHLDVRANPGSGMAFRRLIEDCDVRSLTCIGLDPLSNTQEHFDWFTAHGGRLEAPASFPADSMPRCLASSAPLFVSIDLDVLDAAFAPGVSAMNPAGLDPRTVSAYAQAAGRSPAVRCFDIMELNPLHDESGRTARLAAHIFLEFLRGLGERDRAAAPAPAASHAAAGVLPASRRSPESPS